MPTKSPRARAPGNYVPDEPFSIPDTIEEAEELLIQLQGEIDTIQSQFGTNKLKPGASEDRKTKHEEWEKKARHALNRKLDQLRKVKLFLKKARTDKYAKQIGVNADDPDQLLERMYSLVTRMRNDTQKPLDPDDIKLLDVVSSRVDKQRRDTG